MSVPSISQDTFSDSWSHRHDKLMDFVHKACNSCIVICSSCAKFIQGRRLLLSLTSPDSVWRNLTIKFRMMHTVTLKLWATSTLLLLSWTCPTAKHFCKLVNFIALFIWQLVSIMTTITAQMKMCKQSYTATRITLPVYCLYGICRGNKHMGYIVWLHVKREFSDFR